MRVNPGESYADMIDHAAERQYEFERAIDRIETLARERAEQYFNDESEVSRMVFEAIIEHPAVTDVIAAAPDANDECEMGRRLSRAIAAARIKWVNDRWRDFARHSLGHCDGLWPNNDKNISEGME